MKEDRLKTRSTVLFYTQDILKTDGWFSGIGEAHTLTLGNIWGG